ncbi:MAG TPA: sigma-70 family RNA polymerase sigma factor [Bacteroidia bacterium]|nr:sigma-70 family RNA polymerase sigma factor [Bacteroidia bacterium]
MKKHIKKLSALLKKKADIPSDAELIAAFRNGDKKAFPALSKRWSQKLIDFISYRLGDRSRAADVSQETWMEALLKLKAGHYHEEGKFFQFLCGIAVNKIKHLRTEEGHYVHPPSETLEDIAGNVLVEETGMDRKMLFKVLKVALRKLGCRERTIIVLHYFRGRSFEEIATRLGISIAGARSLCSKALRQLRMYVAL